MQGAGAGKALLSWGFTFGWVIGLLGGSGVVTSVAKSPRIWAISIVTTRYNPIYNLQVGFRVPGLHARRRCWEGLPCWV